MEKEEEEEEPERAIEWGSCLVFSSPRFFLFLPRFLIIIIFFLGLPQFETPVMWCMELAEEMVQAVEFPAVVWYVHWRATQKVPKE